MASVVSARSVVLAISENGRVNARILAEEIDIPIDALAGAFGITPRRLYRKPEAASLQSPAARIVGMVDELSEHFGEKRYAIFWLRTPQPEFGQRTPTDYLRSGRLDLVLNLAHDIVFMTPD